MRTQKIIVMGGSFNPPTVAHLELMEAARREAGAERGIFVPVGRAYLKRKMRKTTGRRICLPETLRLEMLRAMCEGTPELEVSESEIQFPQRFTTETMPVLQQEYPDAELLFLAGADKLKLVTHWAETGDFLTRFRIALVCRDGTEPEREIAQNPVLNRFRDAFLFVTQPKGVEKISSTAIRQALIENQTERVRADLHPAVWELFRTLTLDDFLPEIEKFQNEHAFLSNGYPIPFSWNGQTWSNAEAAIQAARCADPREARFFPDCNADRAKQHARKVAPRSDWEAVRLAVVEEILRAKFFQNPELVEQLRQTGNAALIFGNNSKDLFWGKDLYSDCGENHLGRLLMKIRDTIANTKRS